MSLFVASSTFSSSSFKPSAICLALSMPLRAMFLTFPKSKDEKSMLPGILYISIHQIFCKLLLWIAVGCAGRGSAISDAAGKLILQPQLVPNGQAERNMLYNSFSLELPATSDVGGSEHGDCACPCHHALMERRDACYAYRFPISRPTPMELPQRN